ncbi:DoxX family membrane protein [Salibacterium aidingense]|uniref:DoxX family membrane protein n=1 Tax=Salibacterium aidingense TaxID=384933 RepID=UPI000426C09E|nr:DoxX family membrane protein [Salibacterium aidingense]
MAGALSALRIIRCLTAFVFIVSGLMKIIHPEILNGVDLPFSLNIMMAAALVEIFCGVLLAINQQVKNAVIPLIIIILGAILLTKIPLLDNGILTFLFEARLDIVILGLLALLYYKHP